MIIRDIYECVLILVYLLFNVRIKGIVFEYKW